MLFPDLNRSGSRWICRAGLFAMAVAAWGIFWVEDGGVWVCLVRCRRGEHFLAVALVMVWFGVRLKMEWSTRSRRGNK
ncbi:hypothetical protein BKA61DRAFT_242960 [Leptodontidium sp. MPI-SDFR-AT-0119]|nr:hypothetical protein BKA61DRAFT_242960 [Leptodontidium sp. MPI-SDFR-AT-0119]